MDFLREPGSVPDVAIVEVEQLLAGLCEPVHHGARVQKFPGTRARLPGQQDDASRRRAAVDEPVEAADPEGNAVHTPEKPAETVKSLAEPGAATAPQRPGPPRVRTRPDRLARPGAAHLFGVTHSARAAPVFRGATTRAFPSTPAASSAASPAARAAAASSARVTP